MREPKREFPKVLDAVVDMVLAYRPKPKTTSAKKRKKMHNNLLSKQTNKETIKE
ncbi:MAG: hypothetical protein ACLPOA_17040 [Methylocella sp.]